MTADEHDSSPWRLLRLQVTTDGDPSVLTRLLGHFHNLNITPRRVVAEFSTTALLHVQVDICGLPTERVDLITAKVGQSPSVLTAYWHYL
jgi:hypothetical protein